MNLSNTIRKEFLLEIFIKNTLKSDFDKNNSLNAVNSIFSDNGVNLPQKNKGDILFKEVFAHDKCYLLLEGLVNLYSGIPNLSVQEMILKDNKGNNAHYLVELTFNNNKYYADAYGIFESLSEIEERYIDTEIVDRVYFDSFDEGDPNYQEYKDLTMVSYDIVESLLEINNLDSDSESVCDRNEEVFEMLALGTIKSLDINIENSLI